MHRIGGVTLVQPQSEAEMVLGRCLGANGAVTENGPYVGEGMANVDRRKARLEWDERDNEQSSDWRDVGGAGRRLKGDQSNLQRLRQFC
jgi:hypothetical protein